MNKHSCATGSDPPVEHPDYTVVYMQGEPLALWSNPDVDIGFLESDIDRYMAQGKWALVASIAMFQGLAGVDGSSQAFLLEDFISTYTDEDLLKDGKGVRMDSIRAFFQIKDERGHDDFDACTECGQPLGE
jgi:hypothetical protein